MTGLLTTYLGYGLLADRPVAPVIAPGTLALYRDEDLNVWCWDQDSEEWTNLIKAAEPFPDLSGFVTEAPDDAFLYTRGQKGWVILPDYPDVDVLEAPQDGSQYVRKDGAWTAFVLPEIPDAGIPEAPNDGKLYGRKGEAWAEVLIPDGGSGGIEEAPEDGKFYSRRNAAWAESPSGGGGGGGGGPPPYGAHRYWRVNIARNNGDGDYTNVVGLQFRSVIGGPNQAVGGTAIASSSVNSTPADAFAPWTGDSGVPYWVAPPAQPLWIGYDFGAGNAKEVVEFTMTGVRLVGRMPRDMSLAYSDDGITWTATTDVFTAIGWSLGGNDVRSFRVVPPGTILEAPMDGKQYARKNAAWAESVNPFGIIPQVLPDFSTFAEYKSNPAIATKITAAAGRSHIQYTKADNNWAGNDGMALMRAVPATPTWEIIACVTLPMIETTYIFAGIGLRRGTDVGRIYGNAYFASPNVVHAMYYTRFLAGEGWPANGDTNIPANQSERRWIRVQKTADSYVQWDSRDGLTWQKVNSHGINDIGAVTECGLAICTRLADSNIPRNPRQLAWNVHHFEVREGLSPQ